MKALDKLDVELCLQFEKRITWTDCDGRDCCGGAGISFRADDDEEEEEEEGKETEEEEEEVEGRTTRLADWGAEFELKLG